MNTANLNISNRESALINPDYIKEALLSTDASYQVRDQDLTNNIVINDVSMERASGYGTWKVVITLDIDGEKATYSETHHNEDWYGSQKIANDSSLADSEEEYNEAVANFQSAFESVIDRHAEEIMEIIVDKIENN